MSANVNPGLFHTGNIASFNRVVDMSPSIAVLAPRYAQILFLASRPQPADPYQGLTGKPEANASSLQFGIRTVFNFDFDWQEDQARSFTTQVNNGAGYNSAATDIVVDDASLFAVNDLVEVVRTNETLSVSAVNVGTNTITVARSWGAVAAAAINDDDVLLIIGNTFSENATVVIQPERIQTKKTNYIQDTRDAWATTYVLGHQKLYSGEERRRLQSKHLYNHQMRIERSLIFGEKNLGTGSDGSPRRSTAGLLEQITTNTQNVGGTLSKGTLDTIMRTAFSYGSNEKVLVASPLVASTVSNLCADTSAKPMSQLYVMNNAQQFGFNIMTYAVKYGTLHIIMHGLLTGSVYGGYGIILDPMKMKLCRPAGGFFMTLREDIVKNGQHNYTDEYATYFGLQYENEATAMTITGVTG